jgi:hypothetical protein
MVWRIALAVSVVVAAAGCSHGSDPLAWAGGPVPAQTFYPSPRPSWHPVGAGVRTGIVVGSTELVVYFWAGGDGHGPPHLESGWIDPTTSAMSDWPLRPDGTPVRDLGGGSANLREATASPTAFLGVFQASFEGYPLVEWGVIRARPARIVVEARGGVTEARFTPWPHDEGVTFFWLQRLGEPMPTHTQVGEGTWRPLAPQLYPLVTVYDGLGRVIDSVRIRPPGYGVTTP